MADIFAFDPMKSELHDLLAAIAERHEAEEKLDAQLAGNLDHSEIDLRNTLRSINDQLHAQRSATETEYENARNELVQRSETDISAARGEYQNALTEIERQYGEEVEAAEKEKNDASWMVSSVLDDQSHESPRFQFEALKKRLIVPKTG